MTPLVSILIPAYNCQNWIADTIKSALAQTWPRKEIIVVDDGSDDSTLETARQFESPLLKVIHKQNGGASSARNRALRESQGDYIQWLDADDLIAPDKIEHQLLSSGDQLDPYVMYTSSFARFYYRTYKAKLRSTPFWQDSDPVSWLILHLSSPWMMPPLTWLVSRQLTEKAGYWDERLSLNDDGEYVCRVVSASRYVRFVPRALAYYRLANIESLSHSVSRQAWESFFLSYDLSVSHLLELQNNERTRLACILCLSKIAEKLELFDAPDLADRLYRRIEGLGGSVVQQNISRKYALMRRVLGEKRAWHLKSSIWRVHRLIRSYCDHFLARFSHRKYQKTNLYDLG
jgi:glycosyltransferase involved in cell wall biosynthesis